MKMFNLNLEEKFDVKFDGKFDDDCPESQILYLDPLYLYMTPYRPKNVNFQF
jgi:hypothetical protein